MAITKAAAKALAAANSNIHGSAFTKREAEAVNAAESFTPTTAGDWVATITAQDAALDELASRIADVETPSGAESASGLVRVAIGYVTAAQLVAATSGVAHTCFGSADIPDNAIILDGMVDVLTTFAGDGDDSSTISIGVNTDVDIVAAVAINAATDWDAGLHDIIPAGSAATAVKLTAARDISVTWTAIATDTTLTAGEMRIILRYVVSG